jgi:hypothetical protein
MAKSAPYPPCTVTILCLKYQDRARMLRRVTQPTYIAVPLAAIMYWFTKAYGDNPNTSARLP